jgi:hypothetical protein
MRSFKAAALPLTLLAFGSYGCGIISKDLDGEVRFNFEIDGDDTYSDTIEFDPNSNEDVKNNRDKVEAGTVVEIILELTSVHPDNRAQIIVGQVDVRKKGDPDTAWIQGVGAWSGVPIYDQNGVPAIGQVFKLEIPVATQDKLSDIVFRETNPLEFRLQGQALGWDYRPAGPTKLTGEVLVKLNFTVSAP